MGASSVVSSRSITGRSGCAMQASVGRHRPDHLVLFGQNYLTVSVRRGWTSRTTRCKSSVQVAHCGHSVAEVISRPQPGVETQLSGKWEGFRRISAVTGAQIQAINKKYWRSAGLSSKIRSFRERVTVFATHRRTDADRRSCAQVRQGTDQRLRANRYNPLLALGAVADRAVDGEGWH